MSRVPALLLSAVFLIAPASAMVLGPDDVPEGLTVPEATVYASNIQAHAVALEDDPACPRISYQGIPQPGSPSRAYASSTTVAGCATTFLFTDEPFTARSDFVLDLVMGCERPLLAIGVPLLRASLVVDVLDGDDTVVSVAHSQSLSCTPGQRLDLPVNLPVQSLEFEEGLRVDVTVRTLAPHLVVRDEDLAQEAMARTLYFSTGAAGTRVTGTGLTGSVDNVLPLGGVAVSCELGGSDLACDEVPEHGPADLKVILTPWFWLPEVPPADDSDHAAALADALAYWSLSVDGVVQGGGDDSDLVAVEASDGLPGTHRVAPLELALGPGTHGVHLEAADALGDDGAPLPARTTTFQTTINAPRAPGSDALPPVTGSPADADKDGVPDAIDNCKSEANGPEKPLDDLGNAIDNQRDFDRDGVGDACDEDADGDDVRDDIDNCLFLANDQSDVDGDGLGDACDVDIDDDDLLNGVDICPSHADPDQEDLDGDLAGDACDPDLDGDTIANADDNCPRVGNRDQADLDEDDVGDRCDVDIDGDNLPDAVDNCPLHNNAQQADRDGDGIGDACDTDVDGDGRVDQQVPPAYGAPQEVEDEPLTGADDERFIPGVGVLVLLAVLGVMARRRQ